MSCQLESRRNPSRLTGDLTTRASSISASSLIRFPRVSIKTIHAFIHTFPIIYISRPSGTTTTLLFILHQRVIMFYTRHSAAADHGLYFSQCQRQMNRQPAAVHASCRPSL
ncbi:hypothetical protein PBY51_005740 [Eleginops maclovinus]|uniref:Uncharacterized protein n=1 Tax=Eleginops maclovinus TaxID=56733 RepID=A0AAN7WS40_ELEMC|nr:hypothetical protein PBY51_005740 [Eleginops maclovinus]